MARFRDSRYNRHEQMPEWGRGRQLILKKARVVVVGAGGVKSTLLFSLVAAGIGTIRVVEFDKVELSNLNRQILYETSDIGKPKLEVCVNRLKRLNPEINIEGVNEKITGENIGQICEGFNFVVEGGDSPAGRNLVNEYCLSSNKPFTHASAQFNYGYVFSVIPKNKTACFACFFPDDHLRAQTTGPVPVSVLSTSIAGSLGATEVLKWFLGYENQMLVNKRICFSSLLLSGEFRIEKRQRRKRCPVCSRYYSS